MNCFSVFLYSELWSSSFGLVGSVGGVGADFHHYCHCFHHCRYFHAHCHFHARYYHYYCCYYRCRHYHYCYYLDHYPLDQDQSVNQYLVHLDLLFQIFLRVLVIWKVVVPGSLRVPSTMATTEIV